MRLLRLLFALLAMLGGAGAANADELRPGYLELTQLTPATWRMTWKAPLRTGLVSRAAPIAPANCKADAGTREMTSTGLLVIRTLTCAGNLAGRSVSVAGLDATVTDVLVRVAPLGLPVQTARLTPDNMVFNIAKKADRWEVARTYFVIGVEHIVFGFDHLFFVLALVLLLQRGWIVAQAVTAFTVSHSITLVGTTLGFLGLPQRPVESIIALSIVFLAVEIVKSGDGTQRLSQRIPWVVAFLFGLLHGFGFAGALKEIGLPQGEVPMALLTFNLGVEAGQLAVVLAALAVLALIRRAHPTSLRPVTLGVTYLIGITASYWFIERTLV